ncbi:homoserine dehydrogenase [Carnobacteriaceae bacterium zg-ZUI78]|nr:homoserine dehydrogenase [Carnobacteriaceae bacterium zg-ZUI78]
MQEYLSVGILGFGTVGSGVFDIIQNHQEKMSQVLGKNVRVTKVLVRELEPYQEIINSCDTFFTTDINDLLTPDMDIIVEVIGGTTVAYEYVKRALQANKHIVTANKDLIALYGTELFDLAKTQGVDFYYEASVGGGIPILRALTISMASDEVTEIVGILNGTTNYMLTQMIQNGLSYDEALKQAQALGFAEADPTSDVDGLDAARKVVILTRLGFGMAIQLNDMNISGIRHLNKHDMAFADNQGYVIKLLGMTKCENGQVYAQVGASFVKKEHPLSTVHQENNAVYVTGKVLGETMFYGAGAGKLPTANSVVSDIMAIGVNILSGKTGRPFSTYQQPTAFLSNNKVFFDYYYRIHLQQCFDDSAMIEQVFAKHGVNVSKVEILKEENHVTMFVMTELEKVATHKVVIDALQKEQSVVDVVSLTIF